MLHEGLRDRVFYCAPGEWTLFRCSDCCSGYLDPRPNAQTLHLAYMRYFTHDEMAHFTSLDSRARVRRWLANGYRNWRYGTTERPASRLGICAAQLWRNGRATIDASMRHLPRPSPGQRLLDVGCGNGAFLQRARSAGWEVTGIDFDARAVRQARMTGLDVREGGVEVLEGSEGSFDVITMAHVIEHLPNPLTNLRKCHGLLKPGGTIWLETPNIDALGHGLYGAAWRGLEPPRHLVLFSTDSLLGALVKSGFRNPVLQPYRPVASFTYRASEAIAQAMDPYARFEASDEVRNRIRDAEAQQKTKQKVREFITVKAVKGAQDIPSERNVIEQRPL